MNIKKALIRTNQIALLTASLGIATSSNAADQELLDILLSNGAIDQSQYDALMQRETLNSTDILPDPSAVVVSSPAVAAEVSRQIEENFPVKASRVSSGFRFETSDEKFRTDLQWRAQTRYTTPFRSDPRKLSAFGEDQSNFEARRLRMKIGGHGFQPWLRYYFEVDLQPSRDTDDGASNANARVIDWRIDVAKWDWGGIRLGQWKVDMNRERVDSSGRQQFVERSIANRVFTIDRQVGVQLRGHLFQDTPADMRYFAGVFNGEGRGVNNTDDNMMYMGRLQWNFLGRDVPFRQTDVEYTELPMGSLAIAGATNKGSCTRWSSSGCGNLDGFESAANAAPDQYDINQVVQEFAFKYRGFSAQQELHRKRITDTVNNTKSELTGGYVQAGYFFHNMFPAVPEPLELAIRYAFVDEPNAGALLFENEREELTIGANWFFSGHNNKITVDFSHLKLDDALVNIGESENRLRMQWDVSF
ncbi:MAG: porin [Gammaproteobacteria bacterium]|jgi:phosphate-selective porin|nr:porin [Gammaproteobacteria bacterium]MDG2338970.1 porin [Gammaproteobacteria bacterium]